jgi:hypothetical protein
MGNGGGLGEQNAVFVWTQLEQMSSMLILEKPETAKYLKAVATVREAFLATSMEVRSSAELTSSQLASSREFGGFVAVGDEPQPKFVWVREKLQDDEGSALSLQGAAYWATRLLADRARLSREVSEEVSQQLAHAFATEVPVRALTRYNRLGVRLLTLKNRIAYLESSANIQTLPLPTRLCESQGLSPAENLGLQISETSWMNDENWDVSTSTLFLGARSDLQVGCQDQLAKTVILEGELTWEIPFTLRDSSGAKVPHARARGLLLNPAYALVPAKVSWFGVRGLRRSE